MHKSTTRRQSGGYNVGTCPAPPPPPLTPVQLPCSAPEASSRSASVRCEGTRYPASRFSQCDNAATTTAAAATAGRRQRAAAAHQAQGKKALRFCKGLKFAKGRWVPRAAGTVGSLPNAEKPHLDLCTATARGGDSIASSSSSGSAGGSEARAAGSVRPLLLNMRSHTPRSPGFPPPARAQRELSDTASYRLGCSRSAAPGRASAAAYILYIYYYSSSRLPAAV
eukprot:COSAG05_NODE_2799_length_2625_cov_12.003959_2_plen_224_part_00